jgi:branched-chain amino acid transport system permease protein
LSEDLSIFLQQIVNGLSQGAIYALIALGYTMIYGVLRFVNFAHGDVFMIGAFAGFYAAPALVKGLQPGGGSAATAFLGNGSVTGAVAVLLVAMVICAVLGMAIEFLVYRPLQKRPRLTVLITAIGVSTLLEYGGQFFFGATPRNFPAIINDIPLPGTDEWPVIVTTLNVIVFSATAVLLGVLWYVVTCTRMGTAMRALAYNPVACSLVGINTSWVISFTFALGSCLAGAGGILYAAQYPSIEPLMGVTVGMKAFVAAVLGGIGSIPGAALGGIIMGVTETLVAGYGAAGYRDAVAFAVLILILIVKPSGLLGRPLREKV